MAMTTNLAEMQKIVVGRMQKCTLRKPNVHDKDLAEYHESTEGEPG